MKLPTNESSSFEVVPAGNHLAICYMLVDLGTQRVKSQWGEKDQRKILVGWETPHETMADGRPYVVNNRYTFSMYDKATLRKHLESWRGKPFTDADFGPEGFDLKNILGHACQLNVIHNESGSNKYANVASIAPLMKGTKVPDAHNGTVYFSFDEPTDAEFDALSEGIQKTIQASPEYAKWKLGDDSDAGMNQEPQDIGDEIPF